MKNTIKAESAYIIRNRKNNIKLLFDGDTFIMIAHSIDLDEHKTQLRENEMYHVCEIFTTKKGNQFIYARDEESDEDFLIKINV